MCDGHSCAIDSVQWVAPFSAEVIAPVLARPEDQARFRVSVFATSLGLLASKAQLADGLVFASLRATYSCSATESGLNYLGLFSSPAGSTRIAPAPS